MIEEIVFLAVTIHLFICHSGLVPESKNQKKIPAYAGMTN